MAVLELSITNAVLGIYWKGDTGHACYFSMTMPYGGRLAKCHLENVNRSFQGALLKRSFASHRLF
jgi:hypothetical protein